MVLFYNCISKWYAIINGLTDVTILIINFYYIHDILWLQYIFIKKDIVTFFITLYVNVNVLIDANVLEVQLH